MIERTGRRFGTRATVKAEETTSQTLQNSSRGVKGSEGHNNPSTIPQEREHGTARSGNNQSMVQCLILSSPLSCPQDFDCW